MIDSWYSCWIFDMTINPPNICCWCYCSSSPPGDYQADDDAKYNHNINEDDVDDNDFDHVDDHDDNDDVDDDPSHPSHPPQCAWLEVSPIAVLHQVDHYLCNILSANIWSKYKTTIITVNTNNVGPIYSSKPKNISSEILWKYQQPVIITFHYHNNVNISSS